MMASTPLAPPHQPRVTEHAADRWDQRTPFDSISPERAWTESQRITSLEVPCRADEVRYHPPTRAVLVERANRIVTVMTPPFRDEIAHRLECST